MRIKYDIAKMVTGTIGAGFILYMATNSFLHEVVRWCCVASAIGILFWIVSRVTFIKKHETVWMFVITCVAAIPFNIKVSKLIVDWYLGDFFFLTKYLIGCILIFSLLAAEEIIMGILTRMIWPRQIKSSLAEKRF